MEDYNRVLEATEVAENANGVAAEKMTVYNESLEAAQNRLTASIQQFAQDSNLDRILALAYDGLSKVVEILNILLNKIPVLSPLIKEVGVALAVAFAAKTIANIASTSKAIGGLISAFTSVSGEVGAFASLVAGEFTTALSSGLIPAIGAAGTAITTLLGPVGTIFALLGAIVAIAPVVASAWNKMFPSVEEKAEQSKKSLEESNAELEETQSKIQEIQKQINDINSKGTLTLADEAEKERLQEQLDLLEEIKKTQEAINKEKSEQALSDEQKKAQKMTSYSSEDVSQYQTGLQTTQNYATALSTGNINELIAAYQQLNEEKKNLNSTDEDYAEQLKTNQQLTSSFTTKLLEQKQTYLDEMKALSDLGDTSSETYKSLQQAVDMINVTLNPSNFETVKIQNLIDTEGVSDKLQKAVQAGDEAGQKTAETYAHKFANQILRDDSMKEAFAKAMNIDVDDIDFDTLTQEFLTKFQQMYGQVNQAIFELTSEQVADWTTAATNALVTQDEAMKDYISTVANITEKQEILNTAFSEMKEKGELSVTTVQKLIDQEPSLVSALMVEDGHIRINIDSLQDLSDSYFDTAIETKKQQITQTQSVIDETKKRIEAMNQEMIALGKLIQKRIDAGEKVSATDLDQYRGMQRTKYYLEKQGEQAQETQDDLQEQLDALTKLQEAGLTYTPSKKSSSSKSGKSDADKEFETNIKTRMKYLQGIVKQYSLDDAWNDPATIKKYTDDFNNMLSSVLDSPEKRKIVADALNVDISGMSDEKAKEQLTKLLKEQYGDIQTEYQKLLKAQTKTDLQSIKNVVNAYKDGVYGAWSSDEAVEEATKAYDEFLKKLQDENYRKAMAETLNLGDISTKPVEEQIQAITNAIHESAGTIDDTQQDLYDKASKNIKALQSQIEEVIDTAVNLLEKAGNFLFDMLGKQDDVYQKQLDNLDKIKTKMSREKEDFEDQIDKQKEKLKLEEEELKKKDELKEKNKDIADIDAQLLELQYDNSKEAQAKRLKLLDERAKAEKKLKDYETETSYDTKSNALDKEKKDYEERYKIQERLLEDQKQAIQDAKDASKEMLDNTKQAFSYVLDVLKSDLFKNLLSRAIMGSGQENVTKLLTGYNKIFGTGIDSDVTGTIKEGYKSLGELGDKAQQVIGVVGDSAQQVINDFTSSSGTILNKLGSGIKGISNVVIDGIKSIASNGFNFIGQLANNGMSALTSLGNIGNGIISNLGDVAGQVIGKVIGSGSKLLSNIGGIINTLGQGIGSLFGLGSAGGIGIAAGGGALASAAGTLGVGVMVAGGLANMVGSTVSYWKDTIGLWKDKDKNVGQKLGGTLVNFAKTMIPGYGLFQIGKALFGKHHSGSDFVKKQNPILDKMLGLGSDETVSILKVGEAVVPTWANNATPSSSNNRFTGSPFGSAVDSAVKSARAVSSSSYSTSNAPTYNISMPINIQGDTDSTTVTSLKKEADNIVNRVLKTINNQTRLGGYKNIKAATV